MESNPAATLQKKKINKGKLKKTIKNILCRPDPVFWPCITKEQQDSVVTIIGKHKVPIPEFKKPLWKDIKSLPKDQRPKPPRIEKVEGLVFGITECSNAIQNGSCAAIAVEAAVNPRTVVHTVLEVCINKRVPVVCVEGLRKATAENFGIPTSCLGVKKDKLHEISKIIREIGANKLPEVHNKASVMKEVDEEMVDGRENRMDIESSHFQYLHRTSKKTRVFVPPSSEHVQSKTKEFIGQDFIELSTEQDVTPKKPFMKMVVKRVSNNPNRVKVK